jgi:hypothetical protein
MKLWSTSVADNTNQSSENLVAVNHKVSSTWGCREFAIYLFVLFLTALPFVLIDSPALHLIFFLVIVVFLSLVIIIFKAPLAGYVKNNFMLGNPAYESVARGLVIVIISTTRNFDWTIRIIECMLLFIPGAASYGINRWMKSKTNAPSISPTT